MSLGDVYVEPSAGPGRIYVYPSRRHPASASLAGSTGSSGLLLVVAVRTAPTVVYAYPARTTVARPGRVLITTGGAGLATPQFGVGLAAVLVPMRVANMTVGGSVSNASVDASITRLDVKGKE